MKKTNKFKDILALFITFFKVGALTFGGGYAMIPIIQREIVEKRKWLSNNDILEILAISESTPGPIAVNAATYVGYKIAGFWGSFFSTLGLITPSFIVISIISMFYKTFMSWAIVNAAFKGIKASVVILLINAVFKLKRTLKLSKGSIFLFAFTLIGMLLSTFFNFELVIGGISVSLSILFILFGIIFGVISELITRREK
jgi:chromate transporter